ncbi:UDP-3-O-acyl-N-acetylglucosamine deacetylase [Pseudanabaena galeata UHCC 0370]|jgi:UDP-3-O-[3-hydroxymyristoyl] N-acetylglucosamine deacetylase|uniref:UDP-3-O-acyl-N-acetylglucosamine deacetylase n=1 Tax=Pseudanabaena galeata UHCC 0370 TaxID=3110310 RepID=A0ABU5TJ07_9CYAN|nr:UDP-3-O-acyl-N-acetylglucosamine deacetylase [Pseudanabaena galeata]MEA5478298.1 UDP-3-O-acyl-N-acetylglucosamine deacetylase [Pseudanabaena galeata UHCC 0370]
MLYQQTIAAPFSLSGIGLHSGEQVSVTVSPAPINSGRYFIYGEAKIPADTTVVSASQLSTELRQNGTGVRTVEHLLSALFGMGVHNACIQLDRPELPILDGSALPWVEAIAKVGIKTQVQGDLLMPLPEAVTVSKGDSFVTAIPADTLRFTYGIEYPTQAIGEQWFSWSPAIANFGEKFASEIAPARTFTLAAYIDQARAAGLIKGGSLENALVCDAEKWINPPLRFADEPCRHKLLDLIGDLSLLGFLPRAHILAYKASHNLHAEFAIALAQKL